MAVIITPQAKINAYFESDALSQSTLKGLLKGFDGYVAEQQKEAPLQTPEHFLIGSAVDCILTGEHGEFEKQYYVSQLEKKPSEVQMSIANQVYDELDSNGVLEVNEIAFEDCTDMILLAANDHAWQSNWKDETRVTKIVEACSVYFADLILGYGKEILSSEQSSKIHNIVNSLRTNRRTKRYFDRQAQAEMGEHIDFYYQLPIYFKYKGEDCKALMDLVVVIRDAEGKIIQISPYDLKTMHGNTKWFLPKLKERRYDIQAAWYTNALQVHFKLENRDIIEPFTFIVESTSYVGRPLVFTLAKSLMKIGQSGREVLGETRAFNLQAARPIKGIDQLLEEYKYYVEDGWREDKDVQDCDGNFTIDWEGFVK